MLNKSIIHDMEYAFTNLRDDLLEEDNDETARSNSVRNIELRLANSWRLNDSNVLEYGYQLNRFTVDNVISETEFFEEDAVTDIGSEGLVNSFFSLTHGISFHCWLTKSVTTLCISWGQSHSGAHTIIRLIL